MLGITDWRSRVPVLILQVSPMCPSSQPLPPMSTATIALIETTSDDLNNLQEIARALIDQRLAACVQILPVHQSYFRWEGQLQQTPEQKLQAKTTAELAFVVMQAISERHEYDLPEIGHLPLEVSQPYADWVAEETRQ